jgi:hypothetical protein
LDWPVNSISHTNFFFSNFEVQYIIAPLLHTT